ncbi:hypothetical protein D3C78_684410 [compost metagenome]
MSRYRNRVSSLVTPKTSFIEFLLILAYSPTSSGDDLSHLQKMTFRTSVVNPFKLKL